MEASPRDLEDLTFVELETEFGRARLRRFESPNRFAAVRVSVEWQGSSSDRWGRVAGDGGKWVASLYEKVRREVVIG